MCRGPGAIEIAPIVEDPRAPPAHFPAMHSMPTRVVVPPKNDEKPIFKEDGLILGVKSGLEVTYSSAKKHPRCNDRSKFALEGRYYEGWCAAREEKGEFVQINSKYIVLWKKIATKGNKPRYVTSYDIHYSVDGRAWKIYKEGLVGNRGPFQPKVHVLEPPIQARMIRIVAQSWEKGLGMRFEAYYAE